MAEVGEVGVEMVVMVNSAIGYKDRRKSIRNSWKQYLDANCAVSPLTDSQKKSISLWFCVGVKKEEKDSATYDSAKAQENLEEEQREFGDIVQIPVVDCYDSFCTKIIVFLHWLYSNNFEHPFVKRQSFGNANDSFVEVEQKIEKINAFVASTRPPHDQLKKTLKYFVHADDDSFIKLDKLYEKLKGLWPAKMLYYGTFWNLSTTPSDNTSTSLPRRTRPIRDPQNKSYMPYNIYSIEDYPPFAVGCTFALSADLVEYLVQTSPMFREMRLDVGIGIYLYPLNLQYFDDELIRPYRPMPLYLEDTIVQHYMKPEEFKGYWQRAVGLIKPSKRDQVADQNISSFFNSLIDLGLLRK